MKKYKLRAFGVTKEILGGKEVVIEAESFTVHGLREYLEANYPDLKGLRSLYIAVNSSYAEESQQLQEADEIALIPPVSGG
jgi:sulfur-carrier protein